ncbi:unnamed protein product [Nesidiocoris tenuis]|uniref:Uncharacterized protein n=1 Tax=Nesidiocoris tenuis TaxID=355587 RepID=A0A6H5HP61_9HEMI|nr:unnamed protein product [Nesidiocoris tenuis]
MDSQRTRKSMSVEISSFKDLFRREDSLSNAKAFFTAFCDLPPAYCKDFEMSVCGRLDMEDKPLDCFRGHGPGLLHLTVLINCEPIIVFSLYRSKTDGNVHECSRIQASERRFSSGGARGKADLRVSRGCDARSARVTL